jgi:hypothetical protein
MQGRTLALVGIAALASALAASPASGATVSSDRAVVRDCAAEALPAGAAGADRRSWRAPADGLVTVDLDGGSRPDWDLALFRNDDGRAVNASTSFGSTERATTWVASGDRVVAQACRRQGGRNSVRLGFDLFRLADVPPIPDQRISLESVPISSPDELRTLEALGLDVTEDISPTDATVALYSDAERALLQSAGFTSQTLIADLPAADAADRRLEARAARRGTPATLPSGRTEYRQYADYTTEMKDLADNNPAIARQITIGTTFEGRPIEGLEIAGDVTDDDDGRPAYLNFGTHHAREWPSAELPMEFAIELVEGYGTDQRITDMLDSVRVFIVPVVNVDGFIASRGYGPDPDIDDDQEATLLFSLNDQAAYKRKNCRPTVPGSEALPCNMRTSSGVDLNRNFGAYWGGSGSSSDVTSQSYRGTAPYSEPEAEAVHQFTSTLHPTVFITNHTFTEDGKWLRQPGFDDVIAVSPDEAAMKDLGDDMEAANGWTSELGYETLGDITGATEDWNYFAQGTYGYTPEARGLNFHANYADSVIEEYVGDSEHAGLGVREAFLIAGERAGQRSEHSVIDGAAPDEATLRLHKEFVTPTSQEGLVVNDELETTLEVPASGQYEWDVNPSSRPLVPGEVWTMSCELPGENPVTTTVAVDRGQRKTVNWGSACEAGQTPEPGPTCAGAEATILGTTADDRGELKLIGTPGPDVIVGFDGRDVISGAGAEDIVCAGRGPDRLKGGDGADVLRGSRGEDSLAGGDGADELFGGRGKDSCTPDAGDTLRSC